MHTLESTLRLAKSGQLSKREVYARMLAASKAFQTPGVSEHQAFAKFCNTDEGRELLRIEQSLPGHDAAPVWQAPVAKKDGDGSLWDRLVKAVAKSQNLTYSKAVDAVLSTEEGRIAFEAHRRMEKINAKVGFSEYHMEMEDKIADIQKARRRGDPVNTYPSEYEVAVRNIMQQYPHLTESQAHDEARKANPDAWENHKATKLAGGKPLPRGHVPQPGNEVYPQQPTSQRTPTPRPPMWQSDHSGSYGGNTPARTPYRPDVEPQIKGWWDRQTPRAQSDYIAMLAKLAHMSPESAENVLKGL
jgi:hypothetical protein